jgi:16S rRNA (uracil1498-N3)-methyltransferase
MLRLYVPGATPADGRLRITGNELRHLRTLRLRPGAHLRVLDDGGAEHDVILERIEARAAEARIVATVRPERESPLDLTLAPALLKGQKMDVVIEKATELGVRRIVPVETERSVGLGEHLERWRRIAVAATKQSGRLRLPEIEAPMPLDALLARPWPGLRLVPWEDETTRRFDDLPAAAAAVVVIVGPEGGLEADEVARARAHDFTPVSLGPRILRAETAAIVIAARCQARFGDG